MINAIKDQVVGLFSGNDQTNMNESSANNMNNMTEPSRTDSSQDSSSSWFGRASDIQNRDDNSTSRTDDTGSSMNPSLFVRNKGGDPTQSAHGALKEQMFSQPREVSWDNNDKPAIAPIQHHEAFHPSGISADPNPERNESSKGSMMEKLGSIMSGNRDTFDPSREMVREEDSSRKNEGERESVMDKLRMAHVEASSNQDSSNDHTMMDTMKEKMGNIKDTMSSYMKEDKRSENLHQNDQSDKSMTETVKDSVEGMKETVGSIMGETKDETMSAVEKLRNAHHEAIAEQSIQDPLPLKTPPMTATSDVPDTNFLQNA
jgi:hypothetical protein